MCLWRALSLRAKVPGWAGPSAAYAHIGRPTTRAMMSGTVLPSVSSGGMVARYYPRRADGLPLPHSSRHSRKCWASLCRIERRVPPMRQDPRPCRRDIASNMVRPHRQRWIVGRRSHG